MRNQLVKNALAIWAENVDVKTLEGRKRISQFFTENKSSTGASYWGGAHFAEVSTDGVFDDSKRKDDRGQYCGLFIAYAGLGLIDPDIGYFCLPSTARMNSPARWKAAESEMPANVAYSKIEPGDIITVGTGKAYGTHFALVVGKKGDLLETVEANIDGLLANGKQGRGVVRLARDAKTVRRVYRLDERHFLPQGAC